MTRDELIESIRNNVHINKAMDMEKLRMDMHLQESIMLRQTDYMYMSKDLLKDMKEMTGDETGFDMEDDDFRIWLHPETPHVSLLLLVFDRKTGIFKELRRIVFRSRKEGTSAATKKEIDESPEEVKTAVSRFISIAERLNYLKENNI